MLLRTQHPRNARRRGVILMVVLSLLTLFAIVGLSFVLYADASATGADYNKRGETTLRPDMDPEAAFALVMGQLLYDAPDQDIVSPTNAKVVIIPAGIYSAVRGHSLARNMYGWYYPNGVNTQTAPWPIVNDKAYNGTGRLHTGSNATQYPAMNPYGVDDFILPNYQAFSKAIDPQGPFIRDPERYWPSGGQKFRTSPAQAVGAYSGGFNPSYTYPDLNAFYLAAVRSDGTLLTPSFHRDDVFSYNTGTIYKLSNQSNPNWTNQIGRYLTARPRPVDMGPGFPYPEDDGGDVKNLPWGKGGNDSIWIDVDAPVMTSADGRKYKMLVAPLILDLDGRLNLNVAGNVLASGDGGQTFTVHASNQGFGPWEMNLSKVLSAGGTEWVNVFNGNPSVGTARTMGRYGPNRKPTGTGLGNGTGSHVYALTDYNGIIDPTGVAYPNGPAPAGAYTATPAIALPGGSAAGTPVQGFSSYPLFPPSGYNNGFPYETLNHPLIYNSQRPAAGNFAFPPSAMFGLLRSGGSGFDAATSDLIRLLPNNLSVAQIRQRITTISADLDRPAIMPHVLDTKTYGYYQLTAFNAATGSPTLVGPAQPVDVSLRTTAKGLSEYDTTTWRAMSAALGRINLNRVTAIRYPLPALNNKRINLNTGNNAALFNNAQKARQDLAKEIFNALRKVTGAGPIVADNITPPDPNKPVPAPGTPEFRALRYLAQLAVNIVDYVDDDDYSTPFLWNPVADPTNKFPDPYQNPGNFGFADANFTQPVNGFVFGDHWVYGVEANKLAMNEVYAQYENDSTDPGAGGKPTKGFRVNVWMEFVNPMPDDYTYPRTARFNEGDALLQTAKNGALPGDPAYTVWITEPNTNLTSADNPRGDPDATAGVPVRAIVTDWTDGTQATTVQPVGQAYSGKPGVDPLGPNNKGQYPGFFLLGPKIAHKAAENPQLDALASHLSPGMSYALPMTTAALPTPDVLLRRLACPNLPPNPVPVLNANGTITEKWNPALPYNPYVTVDYMRLGNNNNGAGNPIVADVREFTAAGAQNPNIAARHSHGRAQPFDGRDGKLLPQQLANNANPPQPVHTFLQHNWGQAAAPAFNTTNNPYNNAANDPKTLKLPFDWLVHLDRQVISPVELLHVAGCSPSLVTHQFVTQTTATNFAANQHVAHWLDNNTLLYRLFEVIEAAPRARGVAAMGRVPGKVNINTIWDQEVWRAVCDAQLGNGFYGPVGNTDQYIDNLWQTQLLPRRSPQAAANRIQALPDTVAAGASHDRPFWGQSIGVSAGGDSLSAQPRGIQSRQSALTLLAPLTNNGAWNTQRLLEPTVPTIPAATGHPYQRYELLTKIYNNLTTRSNAFAVFLTVGFFEVTDDTTRPVKLGAEIGRAENRHVRHRMFAIVDRTQMRILSVTQANANGQTVVAGQTNFLTVAGGALQDSRTSRWWQLQPGTQVVLQPNTNTEETVTLFKDPTTGQLAYTPQLNHPARFTVWVRGNPGPWTKYNPRSDPDVVPFFAIID